MFEQMYCDKQLVDFAIGSNCPGISGTVPDIFILSLVPEGIAETHGRRTTKQHGAKNICD